MVRHGPCAPIAVSQRGRQVSERSPGNCLKCHSAYKNRQRSALLFGGEGAYTNIPASDEAVERQHALRAYCWDETYHSTQLWTNAVAKKIILSSDHDMVARPASSGTAAQSHYLSRLKAAKQGS
jgi:hypothetical protein